MQRFAAFLRGINVGGHRIKMDELREILRPLALSSVETVIASGNVVFECDADDVASLEGLVESQLHDRLGYRVDTFIRRVDELEGVVAFGRDQAPADPEWRVHVMFVKTKPTAASRGRFGALETDDDGFRFRDREVFWLRHGGLSDSSITMADLNRALEGASSTSRTLRTIERIQARFGMESP
jgi:uncharacterized protein (DUF1697 family)